MEALGQPVFLLGHSLGGAIALRLALQKPKSLRAIGLIGTGAKLRVHPQILSTIATDFEAAIELLVAWEFQQGVPEELRQARREQIKSNGQAALLRDFTACHGFNVMDRLSEISVPALVVCGRDDKLTPVKYSQYLKDQIREAQLEIVDSSGHNVMLEQPEALSHLIRRFASKL
jgi:pimeloyl-ACP methyl ester carboxylesterase